MDDSKTTRCTTCASEFTDAEIVTAKCCPSCGSTGTPCSISQDIDLKINWHELRLLCIWASNWATQADLDAGSIKSLNSIIQRLLAQRKDERWSPLTLFGELVELPEALEKMGIECDGVELHQGGKQVYPPKPMFKVVEDSDE